jgi:DNA-binding NtrC family response regulator
MDMQDTAEESQQPERARSGSIAYLTLVAWGPDRPRFASLALEGDLVIGRHESCQLSLSSPKVSRFHARFARRGARLTVEDLGSRHGTWVSGQRVERAELELGASVRLADVVIAVTSMALPVTQGPDPSGGAVADALYSSPASRAMLALLRRVAPAAVSVLLQGETGTGKELAARELHLASGRKGPLRVLNCAAIPPHLIEATLFGHERGAFTGADRARAGIFEEAHGGTVLLDEVGELSLPAQAALLRAIETRRLVRVGANREIEFDVRIVSATHRDLQAMTARGEFRLDLLHRLCVVPIELSPLRARPSEIAPLARHFLALQEGPRAIDSAVLARLEAYDWPGNVRELRNVIARAAALAQGPCIELHDLPDALREPASARLSASGFYPRPSSGARTDPRALRDHLRTVEQDELRRALSQSGGNQRRAAALLGLPLRTFERRLRALRSS